MSILDEATKVRRTEEIVYAVREQVGEEAQKDALVALFSDMFYVSDVLMHDAIDVWLDALGKLKELNPLTEADKFGLVNKRKFEFEREVIDPKTSEVSVQFVSSALQQICKSYDVEVKDYLAYCSSNK